MSLLEKVITLSEKIEIDAITTKYAELSTSATLIERDLLKYMSNVYIELNEPVKKVVLLEQTQTLVHNATELQEIIDSVLKKEVIDQKIQVQDYKNKLQALDGMIVKCATMTIIHEGLCEAIAFETNHEYVQAMQEINKMCDFINNIPIDDALFELIKPLHNKATAIKASIKLQLKLLITDHLKYQSKDDNCTISLKKSDDMNKLFMIEDEGLDVLNPFIKFLWKHVFMIIVNYTTKLVINQGDYCTLKLIHNKKHKDNYRNVFAHIIQVVEYLYENFNYKFGGQQTTISYIGDNIRDNLSELIIKFCLNDTIPTTIEGLQQYKEVIVCTQALQMKLIETEIFTNDTNTILDHANNIDVLFINKKCLDYIKLADACIAKELHTVELVGNVVDPNNPFPAIEFAQCSISVSVLDLYKIIEKILIDANNSSELCAGRLYTTANNILYSYGDKMIDYHDKVLETIPQQIAIFYNNCMYLANQINSNHWRQLCPNLFKNQTPFLQDARLKLDNIANAKFQAYVEEQCKLIQTIVKDSGINTLSYKSIDPNMEKSIRQCLRQQELLKTVWQKILNYYIYNQSIGYILNSLCVALICAVLELEDITSNVATSLEEVFKVVLTRGSKLFTDPKEINMYVKNWNKFSELVFVLNSNLIAICDRWADGKGPLALLFTADEVKRLVRALFQNSDKRASVLERIVKR